ncbi:MAG: hypothetical protein ACK41P_03635 [Asticcacaulis sp.]
MRAKADGIPFALWLGLALSWGLTEAAFWGLSMRHWGQMLRDRAGRCGGAAGLNEADGKALRALMAKMSEGERDAGHG